MRRRIANCVFGLLVFAAICLALYSLKFKAEYTGILDSVGNGPQYFYVPHVALIWCTISLMFSDRKAAIAAVICTNRHYSAFSEIF